MAECYFQAGEKARNRSADDLALAYFTQGKAHFPSDIWTVDYDLALRFSEQLAECAYLAGDFAMADRVFTEVENRVGAFNDRLAVEIVKLPCYHTQGKEEMALVAGLDVLHHLGIRIPQNPSESSILYAVLKAWTRFIFSRKDRIIRKQIPPGTKADWASKCLHALGSVAYYLSPEKLLPMVIAAGINLFLTRRLLTVTDTIRKELC